MTAHQQPPTVGATVLRALRRYPDRTAFSWDGGELLCGAALALTGRIQHVLAAQGLTKGDRIGVLSGTQAQTWCTVAAAWANGMVVPSLPPLGSRHDHLFQ